MSQKDLKNYLKALKKNQLEEQIIDLYKRFKDVKSYYDFAFNPKEDKLLAESKYKITKEYFPESGRKPKARRSVAHKYIKKFIQLGVENRLIADLMLYNIEVAQSFSSEKYIKQEAFYLSIFKSFDEAINFINDNVLNSEFSNRINKIIEFTYTNDWFNKSVFEKVGLKK